MKFQISQMLAIRTLILDFLKFVSHYCFFFYTPLAAQVSCGWLDVFTQTNVRRNHRLTGWNTGHCRG